MGWQEQEDGNFSWSDDGDGGGGGEEERRDEERDREREQEREQEQEEERDRERQEERNRERQREREEEARRRAEEEERQRQIEEQRRQVEEEQRRMAEEESRRQQEEAQRQQEEAEAQAALARNQESIDQGTSQGLTTDEPSAMDQWLKDREAEAQARRDSDREYTPGVEGDRYHYGQDPMAVAEAPAPPEIIEPLATPDPVDLDKPKEEDVVAEATRAAEAVYRSGGSSTQAQAAAGAAAAKSVSIDRQSLSTQTPWTQQAFRTQYGQDADAQWVRQHEAELRRNQQTYGSPEPTPGTRPIASAPANTPVAPDRRIGQAPPPRPAAGAAPAQNILGLGAIGDTPAPGGTPASQGLERDTDMLTIRDAAPGGTDAAQIRRSDWNQWPTETQSRWEVTNAVGAPPAPAAPAPGAARPSTALPGIQPLPPRTAPDGIRTGPPTAGEPGGPPLAPPSPPNPNTPNLYPTPPEQPAPSPGPQPVDAGNPPLVGPIANPPDDDDVLELTGFTPDGERVTSQISRRVFESAPAEVRGQYETRVITPGAVVRGAPASPSVTSVPQNPAPSPTINPQTGEPAAMSQRVPSEPPPSNLADPVYARSYNGMTEGWFNRSEVGSAHTLIYDPKQGQTKLSVVDPNTPVVRPHPASQQVRIDSQGNVIDDSRLITPRNEGPLDPNTGAPIARMGNTETTAPPTAAGADDMSVRVVQALDSPTPLTSISELAALVQGKSQEEARGDYVHVINGVGALLRGEKEGVWAEPYLNDVARLAWARERLRDSGERVDPRLAPTDYIENWKDALYGNDTNVPMVREVNQQLIDAAVDRQPRNGKFDWRQVYGPTGENGLVSKQSTSIDCGPNAFSNVLRANGYNADPSKAFTYAKDTGFHNGREFTGPDNFARMLETQTGLTATNQAIPDKTKDPAAYARTWEMIDQELAEGRLVTLSGPGHYWTIASKKDGKYYVGQTGTVAGNPAWATPGELRFNGPATHVITYKGEVDPNSKAVKTLGLKPPVGSGTTNRALLSTSTNSTQQNAAAPAARVQSQMEADAQRRPNSPDLPAHLQQGRPQPGLRAGAAEPADQTATLWQRAYEQTNDREFADGVTALIMSEGGMRGGIGDQGQSAGIFQMYWGGGEGNNFEKWLRDQKGFKGSQREAMNLAKDNDLAMEFYLPKLKKYYDSGKQQGHLIPTQAIAVGGHNSRAPKDPKVWQAYADAWEDYKRGETEATKNTVVKLSSNTPAPAPVASRSDFDPFQGVRQRRGGDNRVAQMSMNSDFQSMYPGEEPTSPSGMVEEEQAAQSARQPAVTESVETLRRDAQNEDPWSKDPAGQVNRHKGMRLYHEMPIQERERIFDESMDAALTAEGITDPAERQYWKDNAKKVVKGAGFPGENPEMNPFAMAGENRGTPLYAAPKSDKSAASNELNSSAIGYYQFIVHDPNDRNKDPYGHRQFVPEGGNLYDPVTQQRMFIRAVRGGKHKGDPASVYREKRDSGNHTWGP